MSDRAAIDRAREPDVMERPEMLASDARPGAIIEADAGFYAPEYGLRCFRPGARLLVRADEVGELYVICRGHDTKRRAGRHYLDGQLTDDRLRLIGLTLVRSAV